MGIIKTISSLQISVYGQGTITSDPSGIDCGSTCSAMYVPGTTVTLTATPASGYIFTGWGGDCASCGTDPTCTVTMNSDKNCTATFSREERLSLALKSTSGRPGDKVTVPVVLSYAGGSTANIVRVQCDITYDAGIFENPSVSLGPSARATGKAVSGSATGSGSYQVTVSGGSGALPAGTIAYVTFTIAGGASGSGSLHTVPRGWDSSNNLVIDPTGDPSLVTDTPVSFSRAHIFSDVASGYWAENFINQIYYNGITTGYGNGTYGPLDNVTRAQMAAFLIRPLRGDDFSYPSSPYFSDVPSSHWSFKYVQKLRELGITTGYGNGMYGPNDNVTRAQMAAFLIRSIIGDTFDYPSTPYFSDVPSSHWAFRYIQKLRELGITTGYPDGTYHPDDNVNRAQMATFLTRTFLQPTYTLSSTASIGTLSADKGIILGINQGTERGGARLHFLAKRGRDYTSGDLEGVWKLRGMSLSLPGMSSSSSSFFPIPLPLEWIGGELTVAEGHYRGEIYHSRGIREEVSGEVEIDERGKVTLREDKGEDFAKGVMDGCKGIIIAKSLGSSLSCYIFTKEAERATLEELAGDWVLYSVTSGRGVMWKEAEIEIGVDGGYTGTLKRSKGTSSHIEGKLSLNEDGGISLSSSSSYLVFGNGVVNNCRSVITATATDGEGNENFIMMVKKAKEYTNKDLEGIWVGEEIELGDPLKIKAIEVLNALLSSGSSAKFQPKVRKGKMTIDEKGEVKLK